ncbi:hypothetical protein ZOSMA_109G00480 [Zostera marina]|uniref:Uncharacterized protein n=1 Tax=Zostera marina TaxID=29655 RepID=A0A0K9Q447_ZOSMR|nr:hypothetical protein ZOSMA_109G00480 [Zostera marina]
MDKCRDSVLHRKKTNEPSKLYIDGCVLCLMVFVDGISFEKRLNLTEQTHNSDGLSGTGSSSSTSDDGSRSEKNYVEQEMRSVDNELDESAKRRKLKGKAVMIHDSKKKTLPRLSYAKKNLVLEKREKQKAEVEAMYQKIFGKIVTARTPKKPKKKKSPQEFAILRCSSRLSANSGTSSEPSPDSK